MIKTSGFTFIHNALAGGYPIVEAVRAVQPYVDEMVIVNCASTDNTCELLEKMASNPVYDVYRNKVVPLRILEGKWGNEAGETLRKAHSKYIECTGDIIIHFEADEVFDDSLIKNVMSYIKAGKVEDCHISVMRLQLEQNFQRCRWYPEPVHRVFPRLSGVGVKKEGHTTDQHEKSFLITEKTGYLWDITNCFRDNWLNRVIQQAKLRDEPENYLMTPHHSAMPAVTIEGDAKEWLMSGKHWKWGNTPFNIPEILRPLVGMVKYEPKV